MNVEGLYRMSALLLLTLLLCGTVRGESKALLIGVDRSAELNTNLPGIGVDLENMRIAAERLGFEPEQIKILEGAEATLPRVKAALHGWLALGLSPSDRALVYFSGYGTRSSSGRALITFDARLAQDGSVTNMLPLSEMHDALAELDAEQVYLIVDAGFSGGGESTVALETLALGVAEAVSKHLFDGNGNELRAPDAPDGPSTPSSFEWKAPNLIMLGADRESVWATGKGSVLTLALRDAVEEAHLEHAEINVNWLKDTAQRYVDSQLDQPRRFGLGVWGNRQLADRALPVVLDPGDGPEWNFYLALAKSGEPLEMRAPSSLMNVDTPLRLTIEAPVAGYLNVISIDAQDQAVALFPNKYHRDNLIEAGEFELPTEQMSFEILAQPPNGRSLVVALLTSLPVDAYELTTSNRDDKGVVQAVFASLSGNATRAFRVVGRQAADARQNATASPKGSENPTALHGAALEFYVRGGPSSRDPSILGPTITHHEPSNSAAVSGIP